MFMTVLVRTQRHDLHGLIYYDACKVDTEAVAHETLHGRY